MSGFDYPALKALATKLGRPASTLFALAPCNDPFYIGPARVKAAEWFADQWQRLSIPTNWHYRRIHYVFVSQDTALLMLDGKPYRNTLECWGSLCLAARDAIALELVPQDAFADHRNAEPIIYLVEPQEAGVGVAYGEVNELAGSFPPLPRLDFDYPTVPQWFHIEIWAEKTTVNDVLEPLAKQYGFNLVTGIGELSATRCREFVGRAMRSTRPVRILYISDFDPAGASMPVAVARKIEFEIHRRSLDLDVQLRPIVLTHEQCIELALPRTPIKETERRATRFEERYGEGGTELDALEALRPGLLRQIVAGEVERYWNEYHDEAVDATCEGITQQFREITTQAHNVHQDEIAALRAEWDKIRATIEAWNEQAKPIWQAITNTLEGNTPDLDDIEWCPSFVANEDPDPLYDSTRSYIEQIDRYKKHQGKPTGRKGARRETGR
jgi:hypothetical protein